VSTIDVRGPVKVGILFLPLGGLLKLAGNLATYNSIGPGIPQPEEAATVTSPAFLIGVLAP